MPVTWNAYQGGNNDSHPLKILYDLLDQGVVTQATTESVTLSFNGKSVVFEGDVNLDGDEPISGMFNSFKIYDGDVLAGEASGYWLDLDVVGDTANDIQSGGSIMQLYEMLTMQPVTFHGSEDIDMFFDGDFAGVFHGNGGDDVFYGMGGEDQLFGGDGKDILGGGEDDDILQGGKGADVLAGGEGSNYLVGGKGADEFAFLAAPNGVDFDTIKSFTGNDYFKLNPFAFADIGKGGQLAAGKFHVGNNAQDANDRIIYNPGTGELFYDADGVGGVAKVKFAVIENAPELSHTDFTILSP
jgi:Ca2+-binding RTX toxin-like protein